MKGERRIKGERRTKGERRRVKAFDIFSSTIEIRNILKQSIHSVDRPPSMPASNHRPPSMPASTLHQSHYPPGVFSSSVYDIHIPKHILPPP